MQTNNKVFTNVEILKALNNIKDIMESQRELNNIIDKRLKNIENLVFKKK